MIPDYNRPVKVRKLGTSDTKTYPSTVAAAEAIRCPETILYRAIVNQMLVRLRGGSVRYEVWFADE